MNATALVLYGVFAAAGFGWRTWAQWRRTGDTGLRVHAEPGTIQWWAKLGFLASLAVGVAAPLAGLAGLEPLSVLEAPPIRVAGLVVALAGIAGTVLAQWQMGASWRVGVDLAERTGLVTGGVFAAVRNPIYTAMLVFAVGIALMVGNVVALIAVAALAAALEAQVRLVEEPYLQRVHGDAYVAYAATAGRFLPGIGRLRIPDPL